MSYRVVLFASLLTLPGASALGQTPATELPVPVAATLADLAKMCSDVGGTPDTAAAVKRADLNADGRDDFVLYAGWIECRNAVSIYGDREKLVAVFAGDAGSGAAEAFRNSVFDVKVEGSGPAAKLWLTTSALECGQQPASNFASETFCDRAIVWNKTKKRFDYAPLRTVRIIK